MQPEFNHNEEKAHFVGFRVNRNVIYSPDKKKLPIDYTAKCPAFYLPQNKTKRQERVSVLRFITYQKFVDAIQKSRLQNEYIDDNIPSLSSYCSKSKTRGMYRKRVSWLTTKMPVTIRGLKKRRYTAEDVIIMCIIRAVFGDSYAKIAGDFSGDISAWAVRDAVQRKFPYMIKYEGVRFPRDVVYIEDVEDVTAETIEEKVDRNLRAGSLLHVLSTLTEREQSVLDHRFGLTNGYSMTLEEVAKKFDTTRERIRQIEAKALRKLRHPSRAHLLKGFL